MIYLENTFLCIKCVVTYKHWIIVDHHACGAPKTV